ncbi:catechol 2,3-dioxygenase [Enterococcus sp. DIV0840]|uniref:VOC family protein n=1 Tax=Enterococcus TaxID=1350 RepID=UPI001A8DB8EE|nr:MULTISPECIES: VOC family protein [Enterococcus]MBO0434582.1 VOC family protein [Enterococcus sp. DIV0849a]MBO0472199.1 VOC family protein [Enterococcus ureasiticus]
MVVTLPKETIVKQVKLNVQNLEKMTVFYTKMIGLVLLKKENNTAFLGAQDSSEAIMILEELVDPVVKDQTTGLYHTAFLLPSRKDLGNSLLWLLQNNVEIGEADHGYSEAIYLSDPEGNGIEIYRDKPISDWDIHEDGEIIGVTEQLDADGVVAEADGQWLGMAPGSRIGHVHLQVADLEETEKFYEQLGFSLKSNFGRRAKFFAAGVYHHHIGTNTWNGEHVALIGENQLGLVWYTFQLPSREAFELFIKELDESAVEYAKENDQITIQDPNGMQIKFGY